MCMEYSVVLLWHRLAGAVEVPGREEPQADRIFSMTKNELCLTLSGW